MSGGGGGGGGGGAGDRRRHTCRSPPFTASIFGDVVLSLLLPRLWLALIPPLLVERATAVHAPSLVDDAEELARELAAYGDLRQRFRNVEVPLTVNQLTSTSEQRFTQVNNITQILIFMGGPRNEAAARNAFAPPPVALQRPPPPPVPVPSPPHLSPPSPPPPPPVSGEVLALPPNARPRAGTAFVAAPPLGAVAAFAEQRSEDTVAATVAPAAASGGPFVVAPFGIPRAATARAADGRPQAVAVTGAVLGGAPAPAPALAPATAATAAAVAAAPPTARSARVAAAAPQRAPAAAALAPALGLASAVPRATATVAPGGALSRGAGAWAAASAAAGSAAALTACNGTPALLATASHATVARGAAANGAAGMPELQLGTSQHTKADLETIAQRLDAEVAWAKATNEAMLRAGVTENASHHKLNETFQKLSTHKAAMVAMFLMYNTTGCVVDRLGHAIGCNADCKCSWFAQCYPHDLRTNPPEEGGAFDVDVGVCELAVVVLVIISALIFLCWVVSFLWFFQQVRREMQRVSRPPEQPFQPSHAASESAPASASASALPSQS